MTEHFHPDLAARARWLPRGVARKWTLPLFKHTVPWLMARAGSRAEEVPLEGCSVFVHRPDTETARPRPALLWMHGGGLLFGDARQDEVFLSRMVEELGIVVASAQYRLAPEHPFPTPLDDCEQAFRWLAGQPGVDPTQVMVGGASAGGHLAAALCQRLKASGPTPSFQLLVYPMLDDRSAEDTGPLDPMFRLWDRASNALGWSGYLRGHDRSAPPPFAVPARTEDLTGLPPAWIGVGSLDLFLDEDRDYAERLERAGVEVAFEVIEGAYHGFDGFDEHAPVAQHFRTAQIAAMARHLRRQAFLGAHPAWSSLELGPKPPDDATGLLLMGPDLLSFSRALSREGLFRDRALPQFVVAGAYTFDRAQLRALAADPHDAIELIVERAGEETRHPLSWWVDTYEYEALGIHSSPAPQPEWSPPDDDEHFVSTGGFFNIPLGLHVPEPDDGPYTLAVTAVCGHLRSPTHHISVVP